MGQEEPAGSPLLPVVVGAARGGVSGDPSVIGVCGCAGLEKQVWAELVQVSPGPHTRPHLGGTGCGVCRGGSVDLEGGKSLTERLGDGGDS